MLISIVAMYQLINLIITRARKCSKCEEPIVFVQIIRARVQGTIETERIIIIRARSPTAVKALLKLKELLLLGPERYSDVSLAFLRGLACWKTHKK